MMLKLRTIMLKMYTRGLTSKRKNNWGCPVLQLEFLFFRFCSHYVKYCVKRTCFEFSSLEVHKNIEKIVQARTTMAKPCTINDSRLENGVGFKFFLLVFRFHIKYILRLDIFINISIYYSLK